MAPKGKAVAVALVGVGAIAAFTLTGGSARAAESTTPAPKKALPTSSRAALAAKYARVYGVPLSLLLTATTIGKMSLATAKDIYPKAKGKLGKTWDGTASGLSDPAINIGLSAYYLSLWWRRYSKNTRQWILSIYAYILGPGTVRKVMPSDTGTLPKPLPANFARVKGAVAKALTKAEIKAAISKEGKAPAIAGAAPLVGKKLAATIPATTTGYQARELFGAMTKSVSNAYVTLERYGSGMAGSVKAARDYLDNTNATLKKYYPFMPESNAVVTAKQLEQLRLTMSTASVAVDYIDKNFGTSFLSELASEIKTAGQEIVKKAADTVGLDKTGAAIAVGGIIGVGILLMAIKK